MGDLSTLYIQIPINLALLCFTGCSFVIYIGLLNLDIYHTNYTAIILIILFTLTRFMEAHMLTTCYHNIASLFNKNDSEKSLTISWYGRSD